MEVHEVHVAQEMVTAAITMFCLTAREFVMLRQIFGIAWIIVVIMAAPLAQDQGPPVRAALLNLQKEGTDLSTLSPEPTLESMLPVPCHHTAAWLFLPCYISFCIVRMYYKNDC